MVRLPAFAGMSVVFEEVGPVDVAEERSKIIGPGGGPRGGPGGGPGGGEGPHRPSLYPPFHEPREQSAQPSDQSPLQPPEFSRLRLQSGQLSCINRLLPFWRISFAGRTTVS